MFATEVEITIANAVCTKKLDLENTKNLVFVGLSPGEKPHAADMKLVENYFIKILLDQVRVEVEKLCDEFCNDQEFVRKFTSHPNAMSMLNHINDTCSSIYSVKQLVMHLALVDEDDLTCLMADLKAYVWRKILNTTSDGCAEMEMLRSLTVCLDTNRILPSFVKCLTEFQSGLPSQSRTADYLKRVMKVDESEKRTSLELRQFLRTVNNLRSSTLFLVSQLTQLLDFYLRPVSITITNVNNRPIMEVIGGLIDISKVLPQIKEKLSSGCLEPRVNELRFIALHMCQIDQDMENSRWHGFNICVMATRINVSKRCVWNVSGVHSPEHQAFAQNGRATGEDGHNGADGYAGESSGNVMILAEEMTHAEWLTVILNGGNGSTGQNGGNGANGEKGTGISMATLKAKFKSPIRFWGASENAFKDIIQNIEPGSSIKTNWQSGCNRFFEAHYTNGQKLICSRSRYFDFHCYLLHKGSEGKAGGSGGVNGLGGQGGFFGECLALSRDNRPFLVKVQTAKGTDGQDGKPGQNGEYGKNGWDVGYTDFSWWSQVKEFGVNENERLTVDFSTKSSDRVYCGYRYDVLESPACYATLKPSILKHRQLATNERTRSQYKEGQRRRESLATRQSVIRKKDIENTYGEYFEQRTSLLSTLSETYSESTMNFNLVQRQAKKVFDEVEQIQEREREKISRYTIYEDDKKAKVSPSLVTTNSTFREQQKSDILKAIVRHPHDDRSWARLLDEEFSNKELQKINPMFENYTARRTIGTAEIQRIRLKFRLAEFQESIKSDVMFEDVDEISEEKCLRFGKYLKISNDPITEVDWIREHQEGTFRNSIIEENFNELLKWRLSVDDLKIVKAIHDQLTSIEIAGDTLGRFLDNFSVDLVETQKELSQLRTDEREWKKLLNVLETFTPDATISSELRTTVPVYHREVLNDHKNLSEYIFNLKQRLSNLRTTNDTIGNIIEWLVFESVSSDNTPQVIKRCIEAKESFRARKAQSLETILEALESLHHRSSKARWQKSYEYPHLTQKIQKSTTTSQKQAVDKELLQKMYEIYAKKADKTIDWHSHITENVLECCLKKMKSSESILFSPLLELIAWKYEINIRVYTQADSGYLSYLREHFQSGRRVENLLLNGDRSIERLVLDRDFLQLDSTRQNSVHELKRKQTDGSCSLPCDEEYSNEKLVIDELCQYLKKDDRDELETRLEKLTKEYIGTASILPSLLHCFRCNGCHLDPTEMILFVNTIVECTADFDLDPEFWAHVILSHRQPHLIDEFVLIELENSLRRRLKEKQSLREALEKIKAISVKILLTKRLHGFKGKIDESSFLNMLHLLPFINNDLTLLKQLDLSDWSSSLRETYWQHVLQQGGLDLANENLEQCAFYLVKLECLYERQLVEFLIDVLRRATMLSTKALLTFVHRFYAEDVELCDDILTDLGTLIDKLRPLVENENVRYSGQVLLDTCRRNAHINTREWGEITSLMARLGLAQSDDRKIDRLDEMMTKGREQGTIYKHVSQIAEILQRTEASENCILQMIIQLINEEDRSEVSENNRALPLVYETCCSSEDNLKRVIGGLRSHIKRFKNINHCHFYLLDIVNRAINFKRNFALKDTQKLVVLLMLLNERSLLAQIATGEGKTLIITTLCIIKCLYGEKLDIVTSCSVLAKRDAESEPPKGNKDLYALFGINVGHICSEDLDQRTQTFNRCDVVYGDLSSFQRDYLLDRFYGRNILGQRNFENVIVDEVDSMLLDNGNNMLYLSHDIPNMDKLQSLFIFIWRDVNQPVKTDEDLAKFYDNSAIKESVIADLYGMVMRDAVDSDVWNVLIQSQTIGKDGRLLKNLKDYTTHVGVLPLAKLVTKDRLTFLLNAISSRERFIKIPPELYEFAEQHLDKFIDNAKNALFMSEGTDYVIDVDRTGLDSDLSPKIIIIDKNTGTDQSSSQWHEGLHQFLQIKHGCKLSLMSLKAVFVSNVSYLKLYQNLYGLSGTLGSRDDNALLKELYSIDLIKIPTSKPKNFFEERPSISGFRSDWIDCIFAETTKKVTANRSVLIICDTVKDVDYVTKNLSKRATEKLKADPMNTTFQSLQTPHVYKREHEEFTFGQGNAMLTCGKVIIATNLAGRGTDIKLEEKLVEAGGLHVIVTFLPNNCRIEEQAYGRAARCGEPGSGQLVIIGSQEDHGTYSSQIFQLKNARDVYELQRLKTIKQFYDERITVEESCFKVFQRRYEDLRQRWAVDNRSQGLEKLLLDSFLDQWAFWLDRNSELIERQTNDSKNKELLFERLNAFCQAISVEFSQWLTSPSQMLKLGNHYASKANYILATKYFQKIIDNHPFYMAEALYYKSFLTIKQNRSSLLKKSERAFQELQWDLLKARLLFQSKIDDCSNYQAIVESFKRREKSILIHIEAFSEQQKMLSQIHSLFVKSIDDILGHTVSSDTFVNHEMNDILAYDLLNSLKQQGFVTKPRTIYRVSEENLNNLAEEYGMSMNVKQNLCRSLNTNRITNGKSLGQVLDLPNMEEFWSMLKKDAVIVNESEFLVVNNQRLALIGSEKIKSAVEWCKIKTGRQKCGELQQYPLGEIEENIFCSENLRKRLDKDTFDYLEERAVIFVNRRATIDPKNIQKERQFAKFDSIALSDLTEAKVSADEAATILGILSGTEDGILKKLDTDQYRLKDQYIDCSLLPQCYQDVVGALLNARFAYQIAYRRLQEEFNEMQTNKKPDIESVLQIRLRTKLHDQLFFDLIDTGLIEDSRVNYSKVTQTDSKNILSKPVVTYAEKAQNLYKEENLEFIRKTLEQLGCGIEKYETPDVFYSSLEGVLRAQQNLSIVEVSWFALDGLEDLIVLQEQRYSWKFWRNFAIVVGLAVAQITAGAVLEIVSVGIGTYGAAFLINEGISDLFFATGCLCSGYMTMSSYWQHKKWSMAVSAVTCMIGGVLARGRNMSRIGYKIAGPVRAEGGKKVAQMAGKKLIQTVGGKAVARETIKRIGFKTLEGVAFGLAQGAVDQIVANYLNGLCESIRTQITGDLDKLFREDPLQETVLEAFSTLGEAKSNLLMEHVTRECFEKTSMLQTMYSLCRRVFGAVLRGIGEGMRKCAITGSSNTVQTVMKILQYMPYVSLGTDIMIELIKLKVSAKIFLSSANKIIRDAIEEHKLSQETKFLKPSENPAKQTENRMQEWKKLVIETSNQAIANQIVAPVLSFGTNQLMGLVGNAIKKKHRSMKENSYEEHFDNLKKTFDQKKQTNRMNSEEHQHELKAYHDSLMKLLSKTRSAKLFSKIVRENVPMDMVCVQACTHLVHNCMSAMKSNDGQTKFTGIRIVVEGSDGSTHDFSSVLNPSHTVRITLDDNHFVLSESESVNGTKNNCLFEALANEIPALKKVYTDGTAFRHHLSNHIENDRNMRYTISEGWHRFSIMKGTYGGNIVAGNYDRSELQKRNRKDATDQINRIYKQLPQKQKNQSTQKIRDEALACLDKIESIVNDVNDDRKVERIYGVSKEFDKWLSENTNDSQAELQRQYKKIISSSTSQSVQTLHDTYRTTLLRFKEVAQQADDSPTSRTAVHLADRVNISHDNINSNTLCREVPVPNSSVLRTAEDLQEVKSMWRSDPDALASVIHGQLNQSVVEDDRRFNTVAVGINDNKVYVALNHISKENGQEKFDISFEQSQAISSFLKEKKILPKNYEIFFLSLSSKAKDQAECREPHGEMQILSYFEKTGAFRQDSVLNGSPRIRIGASKPPCLHCSLAMTNHKVDHKIYGKANTSPKNWAHPKDIETYRNWTPNARRHSR